MTGEARQNVLITGAAAGIGQATAAAFARAGARLVLGDVMPMDESRRLMDELESDCDCVEVDVSDQSSVERLVAKANECVGCIDVAVHCAGVLKHSPLLSTPLPEFDTVIAVNLRGTFLVGQEVLRHMNERGSGRLINIASDLSYLGRPEFSAYCASKAGVLSLTRTWAQEFAPGILVNAICPGPIDTAMLDEQNMSEEWREKERDIPLRRFGSPREVADIAVFLAGDGATFITGQGLGVNGGSVMT